MNAAGMLALVVMASSPTLAHAQATCPQTTSPVDHTGGTLQQFATDSGSGIVYDTGGAQLRLTKAGGLFASTQFSLANATPHGVCAGDFDEDGWVDFVSVDQNATRIELFKNKSYDNPTPDWSNPAATLTPKFEVSTIIEASSSTPGRLFTTPGSSGDGGHAFGCGDLNGDGHQDFVLLANNNEGSGPRPYRADAFLGNGAGGFTARYQLTSTNSAGARDMFNGMKADSEPLIFDYNGDGRNDIILASSASSTSPSLGSGHRGIVRVYFNQGDAGWTGDHRHTFNTNSNSTLVNQTLTAGNSDRGFNAVTFADFNEDGIRDLAAVGVSVGPIRIYYGLAGGGFSAAATNPSATATAVWNGTGGQTLMAHDYNLDSRADLILTTDYYRGNPQQNARWVLWNNQGSSTYVSHTQNQYATVGTTDSDLGFAFDYDNDPDHTIDFLMADGNNSTEFQVFANRVQSTYVDCGEVASGIIDLGALASTEMIITAARITPTHTIPSGTSITYYMSNETPANWQLAALCPSSSTDYCVTFPKPTGRDVRWKAVMCSNAAHTVTPTITATQAVLQYVVAAQHHRAGVVVDDGVAYIGAFRQPGERGHFYASNASLTQTYWDAGAILDATSDSSRKMYTADLAGTTRLDWDDANASDTTLQATMNVTSSTEADELIDWQRGARFGVASDKKLGAILTSTAAVLSPPVKPYYYNFLTPSHKSLFDNFITTQASRPRLALVASKDGALHAFRTDPDDITGSTNGTEAWAFIPPRVAAGFAADKAAASITSYADGSPTLADVIIGGAVKTIALIGGGNGGKSFVALDVTETISASNTVVGPTPLWDYTPGGGEAGQATSKAVIIRTKIGANDRFLAVMATGVAYDNQAAPWGKGLDVEAVDVATGTRVWRFRAECPVTTDLAAFETDDDLEPGSPLIDSYIDRVIFADNCGNLYKVDPNQEALGNDTTDGWITGMGPIDTGADDPAGNNITALWSVVDTSGALGVERPIAGTMGARPDTSGRMTIFFGTGGIESFDTTQANAFYGVYADDGTIRDKVDGACAGTGGACEKFYGGIVVTPTQVLVTRAYDPPVATSGCDLGSAELVGLDLADLDQQFVVASGSSIMSALFGDGGGIYATTLEGSVIRVGTPSQGDPGSGSGPPTPVGGGGTGLVKRQWWKQVQ
ncbi:MAG: VCBS repeat-containing protein [Kofleriaceae bacterium]|nr:VCBS repeat-containing protein [Kofleriaceae bacterium]MBP6835984.1 VCBS repeat-containing protein [Kofleriaceae bacterium]